MDIWDTLTFDVEEEVKIETDLSHTIAGPPLDVANKLSWLKQRKQWCDCVFVVGPDPPVVEEEREEEKEDDEAAEARPPPQLQLLRSQSMAPQGPARFYAHRLVLAAASSVLESMLFPHPLLPPPSGVKGKGTVADPLQIRITDVEPLVFDVFINCIYKDDVEVNTSLLDPLIRLSKKYQVPKIQAYCAEFMEKDVNMKNALELFQLAPALLGDHEFGADFIRQNVEDLLDEATGDVYCLSGPRLRDLLAISDLESDELFLFDAVCRWGKRQLQNNPKRTLREVLAEHDILTRLHFPTMTLRELSGVVFPTGVLTDEEVVKVWRWTTSTAEARKPLSLSLGFPTALRKGCVKWDESLLLDKADRKALAKMFECSSTVRLELVFRATRDGFRSEDWHRHVDGKMPTLTVIRPTANSNVFGGYFEGSWAGGGSYSPLKAWIFSLKNALGKPAKMIPTNNTSNNAYCSPTYGPTFGGGHDLHISNQMNSNSNYTSPSSYTLAPGYDTPFTRESLAGTYNFMVGEMESFVVRVKS